jgi:predicted nuclease with RNAse H fold
MTPTMTRMVYLTLRGVFVAGHLERSKGKHPVHIIETHPAGALVLRGFPAGMALGWKLNEAARRDALLWMREHGVQNLVLEDFPTSHDVAACAAAFGAWKWHGGESVWASPAAPPLHPYDFAC